jgi:hypothetical protein
MVVRLSLAVAASILGSALVVPAYARPPTATVSPGYDARLIESRKLWLHRSNPPSSQTMRRIGNRKLESGSRTTRGIDVSRSQKKGRTADVAARPSLFLAGTGGETAVARLKQSYRRSQRGDSVTNETLDHLLSLLLTIRI